MGQGDVLDVLKKNKKKWWSLKELQTELNHISKGSVSVSVKKLRDSSLVHHELRELKIPLSGGRTRKTMAFIKWKEGDF